MKLQARRYHGEYEKWRQKAVRKQKEVDQKLFEQKGKGHWHFMKSMQNRTNAKALIALRRTTKGPRGQPKGSITTDPEELDQIIREAYGKIYDGNSKDQEGLKEAYLRKYEQHIFTKKVAAEAETLTGKDLELTMQDVKETAAGLDQWAPADLKMLSQKPTKQ